MPRSPRRPFAPCASLLLSLPLFLLAACSSDEKLSPLPKPEPPGAPPPEAPAPEVGCEGCIVLTGGVVFDGTQAGAGTVVLRHGAVDAVVFGEATIVAGEIVDTTGKTVLPGLFDLHVHTPAGAGPYGYLAQNDYIEEHLKASLRAGVTAYLDLGTSQHVIFELRDRLGSGKMLGPSLFAAGPLLTATGGHPCYSGSPARDFCLFVDSPADASAALDALLPEKPDIVKIVVESGLGSPLPQLPDEAMAAVVQETKAHGIGAIAHVSEAADVEQALAAGVRAFAHLPAADVLPEALAAELASSGVVVVPTLAVYDSLYRIAHGELEELGDPALLDDVPAEIIGALQDPAAVASMTTESYQQLTATWRENALANLRACHTAGVAIAAGTDAGNPGVFHGIALRRELALYVEGGMTPVEALAAATRTAADLLGRADLGRLEAGSAADVLVVGGDATADIGALASVERVYKGGQLLDRQALALPSKTSLVQTPTEGLEDGATCLAAAECAPDHTCDWNATCSAECQLDSACGAGNICFPQGVGSSVGFCLEGDGCDPLQQNCPNGEACIFWGNSATSCWWAGSPAAGQPCSAVGTCAPGHQCNYAKNECEQICDPASPMGGGCPAGQICVDKSALAGIPVGLCN